MNEIQIHKPSKLDLLKDGKKYLITHTLFRDVNNKTIFEIIEHDSQDDLKWVVCKMIKQISPDLKGIPSSYIILHDEDIVKIEPYKEENMIKEVADWGKFFSPKTVDALKKSSVESRKKMLGNKNLMQSLILTQQVINVISAVEKDYIPELENLAVQLVQEAYPIVVDQDIKINAKIVQLGEINLDFDDKKEDLIPIQQTDLPENEKRRIINGITQGAGIRGGYAVSLFKDYLDAIDESLLEKYKEVLNLTLGIYDDEEAIAMLLAMLAQNQKQEGGSAEGGFNEEEGTLVINAKGINFAILVYEIIKGLYEIVSLQGFTTNKNKNKQIVKNVDRLDNEPDDLRYGKFIYDALNKLFINSKYNDPRFREHMFAEIYQLENDEFKEFIENAINGTLSLEQKSWVDGILHDINSDVKKDDTDLEDLD